MVQRKASSNKLGIHSSDHHLKSETLSLNHKAPSSSQEGKYRGGADLKKKMKRSRSFKHSDKISTSQMKELPPQPGKPPPQPSSISVPATAVTPKKKESPAKSPQDASPNYMKSTSSSAAKKEQHQVSSSRKTLTKSKHNSSGSGNKPTKTLARTSSLKVVKTLTKSPSFKSSRTSSKKCSHVFICENLEAGKTTCSSTLKDSKFPAYLPLNPGGTESEGTSAMRVCPYSYCSLNGHHHEPLPPLKCFLSVRRRALKAQKSLKLGCISPRRTRPSKDIMKVINDGQTALGAKPSVQEDEELTDFFLEIYASGNEGSFVAINTDKCDGGCGDLEEASSGAMPSFEDHGERSAANIAREVEETLTDAPKWSDNDFEDDFSNNVEATAAEKSNPENLNVKVTTPGCLREQDEWILQGPSLQEDESDSEVSDMQWEAEKFPATFLDEGAIYLTEDYSGSGMGRGLLEVDNHDETDCQYHEFLDVEVVLQKPFNPEEGKFSFEGDESFLGSNEQIDGRDAASGFNDFFVNSNFIVEESAEDSTTANEELTFDVCDERLLHMVENQETDQKDCLLQDTEAMQKLDAGGIPENSISDSNPGNEDILIKMQDHSSDKKAQINHVCKDDEDDKDQICPLISRVCSTDVGDENILTMDVEPAAGSDVKGTSVKLARGGSFIKFKDAETDSHGQPSDESKKQKWKIRSKKGAEEMEALREFNPREPNYLPMEPDPEGERVDLRHQMMDERKNAEEWMVDYALRQAVSKLAPARNKKVALLVEAFETVSPVPRWETRLKHTSPSFSHVRSIQACN